MATLACALTGGCTLEKSDDVSAFREAIPEASNVAVTGPEGTSAASRRTNGEMPGRRMLAEPTTEAYAHWYGFTRGVRDGVNAVTAVILGSVWYVVHTEPSDVAKDQATWGPYTDALDPVTWRFRVTRVAEDEYDYLLEGRPKSSKSDAEYRAVLKGKGFGRPHLKHGDGEFTIDLDVARALDPIKHKNDSGTVRIVHDLPRDITERIGSLPRTITADIEHTQSSQWLTIISYANEDGTGRLDIDGHVDIDESKTTQPEDVTIDSQWRLDGQGRADISIASGDVPQGTVITAVECWGTDFARTHYADSANYEPTEGSASACAFSGPPGN